MDFDWLDDFLENVEATAEIWQLDYIDELLRAASISPEENERIEYRSSDYTQKEAAVTIMYLKQNQVFTDCRDKFKFYNKRNKEEENG